MSDHVDDGYRIANYDASQEALSEAMGELTVARDAIATRDKLIGEALPVLVRERKRLRQEIDTMRCEGRLGPWGGDGILGSLRALIAKIEALQDKP